MERNAGTASPAAPPDRIPLRFIRTTREIFLDVYLNPQPRRHTPLPSKEDVLAFIGREAGNVGPREIARAFGLKNADRAALKQMLRDLADEGAIEKRRKKLHRAGALPEVVLADIAARDADG